MSEDDVPDVDRGSGAADGASLAPVPFRNRVPGLRRRRRVETGPDPEHRGAEDGDVENQGRVRGFLGAVADRMMDTAPRIPVRGRDTLRRQFPELGTEEIADRLVSGATKGSATVGAGVGAAAMMPVPPAMPAELAAELVGVASIEIKLIAELHELYGCPAPGTASQRAFAYLSAWSGQRGVNLAKPTTLNAAMGGQLKRELREQIMKRTMRNLPNLTPFLVGAAVGAWMNRRDTAKLAQKIRADLRRQQAPWGMVPAAESQGVSVPGGSGRVLGAPDGSARDT